MTDPWENPAGTDGFEFIEYAAPDPRAMGELFERLGFKAIARHRHKNVILYRQGGVNYIVNAEPDSFAQRFAFDLERALRTDYLIDRYQGTYFVIDSFEQLMRETAPDFAPIYDRLRSLPILAP